MNSSGILGQKDLNCSNLKLNSTDQLNQTSSSFLKDQVTLEVKSTHPKPPTKAKSMKASVKNESKENQYAAVPKKKKASEESLPVQDKCVVQQNPDCQEKPAANIPGEQQEIEVQLSTCSSLCCFCGKSGDTIMICNCALSHKSCVDLKLNDEKVDIVDRLRCGKCLFNYPLVGHQEYLSWKQQEGKVWLVLNLMFFLMIVGFVVFGTMSFVQMLPGLNDLRKWKLIVGMTLFYTISFCMSICLVSKIVGNFILIKYNYEESRSVKKAMVKK